MLIARTRAQLRTLTDQWEGDAQSWAFVPTMGALHEGHLTLVREALVRYPRVVVSVFVNPTQFDRADDLERYPRQPEADAALLRSVGAHALLLPSVEEVYPEGPTVARVADLGGLDAVYEGALRPGHFDGVVEVVRRLVGIVQPEAMYMGQKDAQQVAVLRRAARQEFWPVRIVSVPIVREETGLAMSSRNGQLSPSGFAKAALIHACLVELAKRWRHGESIADLQRQVRTRLSYAGFRPEYVDFVDAQTFTPLPCLPTSQRAAQRGLIIAVAWIDGVRLIDNLILSPSEATRPVC